MRRNVLKATVIATALSICTCFTSFAGIWQQDATGYWYQNDDGSYAVGGWQWIDGKCYYFDGNGYMLANTTTPDGYQVNADGAWTENGIVKTQAAQVSGNTGSTGNHSAGYDPARPLAGKIDEWNLRLTPDKYSDYISDNNIQAMLTGQMDQYFLPPVGDSVDAAGNHIYISETAYNNNKKNETDLYNWYCNWLNSFDFANMNEMERAQKVKEVLAQCTYDDEYASNFNTTELRGNYAVLINKKGICTEFAMAARSLATALGLKSAVAGDAIHAVYYIWVDGECYMGENQFLNLDYPNSLGIYGN